MTPLMPSRVKEQLEYFSPPAFSSPSSLKTLKLFLKIVYRNSMARRAKKSQDQTKFIRKTAARRKEKPGSEPIKFAKIISLSLSLLPHI